MGQKIVVGFRILPLALGLSKVQSNLGSAFRALEGFNTEVTRAIRLPTHGLVGRKPCSSTYNRNLVGNNKRGVKANPKLTNKGRVFCRVTRELSKELFGTRSSNGAKVGNNLVSAHTNAVIGNSDRSCLRIETHCNAELGILFKKLFIR